MTMAMTMIDIENVTKAFNGFTALNSLNLQVKKGSIYGLVGVNGAGKTTVIKHLAGLYRQDAGHVTIAGRSVYNDAAIKARVGYIPDDLYFFNNYSIKAWAAFYRALYRQWDEQRYRALSALLRLDEKRKLNRLSKGMQKQAAFVFAMAIKPDVLLLDEPIDGLDPVVRKQVFQQIIDDVAERALTVLISSHNLKEMEGICDAIGIMKDGQMLIERDLDDLKSDVHKIQAVFPPNRAMTPNNTPEHTGGMDTTAIVADFPGEPWETEGLPVLHAEKRGSVSLLVIRGPEAAVTAAIRKRNPLVFDMLPLSLEEIFIYETEGAFNGTLD